MEGGSDSERGSAGVEQAALAALIALPPDLRHATERYMPGLELALVDLGEASPDAFASWSVRPMSSLP